MAWIFRKRKKLLPGVHLNYGSSGLSLNVGVPGASVTLGKDGVYANTGLPGTGIRNRQKVATTEPQGSENIQIAEKDIKRAGCFRNLLYYFCYLFSYAIIITLWLVTGYTYSSENYYYLIPAAFELFFIINTMRLHLYHHRSNVSSSLIFPIVLSILFMSLFSLSATIVYFFENEPVVWSCLVMLDMILAYNLYVCFKYRVKREHRERKITEVVHAANNTAYTASAFSESDLDTSTKISKTVNRPIITQNFAGSKSSTSVSRSLYVPNIDYTQEGVLFFTQSRVRKELTQIYTSEFINVCAYVISVEKCVLSDIQAELGLSYQKVLEAVKLLEKTHIVKTEGTRRKVMITDETTAIRLLLRYASENYYE